MFSQGGLTRVPAGNDSSYISLFSVVTVCPVPLVALMMSESVLPTASIQSRLYREFLVLHYTDIPYTSFSTSTGLTRAPTPSLIQIYLQ